MSIREGQNNRRVSFDTREDLGDKIDKLAVMISKYTKIEVEIKIEDIIKETIRIDTGQITCQIVESRGRDRGQFRQDRGRNRFEQSYRRNCKESPRHYGKQNSRGGYRNNTYRNENYDRGRNRSRERLFSRNYDSNRTRSTSNSRLRSGSRAQYKDIQ